MDMRQHSRQVIRLNKIAFESSFDAMSILHMQTERMIQMWLDQTPLMPAEGKRLVGDWLMAYRKGRLDFRNAVDDSYKRMDGFLE